MTIEGQFCITQNKNKCTHYYFFLIQDLQNLIIILITFPFNWEVIVIANGYNIYWVTRKFFPLLNKILENRTIVIEITLSNIRGGLSATLHI